MKRTYLITIFTILSFSLTAINYTSGDVNLEIPYQSFLENTIIVEEDFEIEDINITTNITFTDVFHIIIQIMHNEQYVILFSYESLGANFSNTIFDDEATRLIVNGSGPFTGRWQPEELLSLFDGMSSQGEWIIQVYRNYYSVEGTLDSWEINFNGMEGNGTEANPFQMDNLDHLSELSRDFTIWDKNIIQTSNIYASETISWNNGEGFSPIGSPDINFTGSFNGQNYLINGLYINREDSHDQGLFGYVIDGDLSNINVQDCYITGNDHVGGVAAHLGDTSTIIECSVSGDVNGDFAIGGLVGRLDDSNCFRCKSEANVTCVGGGQRTGGLAGYVYDSSIITDSYAVGRVTGNNKVGGLVGHLDTSIIQYSYSAGEVVCTGSYTGGMVGYFTDDPSNYIYDSYWNTETSGQSTSNGGTGITTSQMQNQSYYPGSWDFEDIWEIRSFQNNGFPIFQREPQYPELTTNIATDISYETAVSGGNVTSSVGVEVIAKGVCWSTSPNPTLENNFTNDGAGLGEFTSTLTNLSDNTEYFYRAYATNLAGTAYGEEYSFTTEFSFAGNISSDTVWNADNIFINGDVEIENGVTLTINPGTEIIFTGHHKLNVQGRLLAEGTETDSIKFTAYNPETGWAGIRFLNTPTVNDSSKIVHCILEYGKATGNYPDKDGGSIYIRYFEKVLISDSRISNNSAENSGGGIYCTGSSPQIKNCNVSNNSANDKGGGISLFSSTAKISNCRISGNSSANTYYGGGGIYCHISCPEISNCIIENNLSEGSGGGISFENFCSEFGSTTEISNCQIRDNFSESDGGGIFIGGSTNMGLAVLRIKNCLITDNVMNSSDDNGSAIYLNCSLCALTIENTTISNNTSTNISAAAVYLHSRINTITNSIIWGNSGDEIYSQGSTFPLDLSHSCVEGEYEGTGNINQNPQFVGAGENHYLLTASSPCIDAGDPNSAYDPDGTIADMGAYYFDQCSLPKITGVSDIPNDQGRHVNVVWKKSSYDTSDVADPILNYQLWIESDIVTRSSEPSQWSQTWRMVDETNNTIRKDKTIAQVREENWILVSTIPATQSDEYSYIAETHHDFSNSTFYVSAHASEPETVFSSIPKSGFSEDNIPPNPTENVLIEMSNSKSNIVTLIWDEVTHGINGSPELNGIWYKIYGSDDSTFDCNEETFLGVTQNTDYLVGEIGDQKLFFKIIVTDHMEVEKGNNNQNNHRDHNLKF